MDIYEKIATFREDIKFVVGRLKGQDETTVQTVIFDKGQWSAAEARTWLSEHDFKSSKLDETEDSLRFRQREPGEFEDDSFRTIEAGESRNKSDKKKKMKGDPELFELNGVEIFRTGTWNGDKFTEKDLDDMVDAFNKVGFRPPIKLGHKEASGSPAFGWVKSLQRKGDKLIADFMDLPQKVFDMIKARQFDSVSSEIFFNIKRGEQKFRRALKAVALLGAETPAVADLKPIRDSFTDDMPEGAVHIFTIDNEVIDMDVKELQDELKAAQDKIKVLEAKGSDDDSEKVKKLEQQIEESRKEIARMQHEQREKELKELVEKCRVPAYREFLEPLIRVATGLDEHTKTYTIGEGEKAQKDLTVEQIAGKLIERVNHDVEKLFSEVSEATFSDMPNEPEPDDNLNSVSEAIDKKIVEYQEKHEKADYGEAMTAVLQANPDLARRYNQS